MQDSALDNRYVGIGGTTGILGEWGVERAGNEYEGGITAREAIANGKRTPPPCASAGSLAWTPCATSRKRRASARRYAISRNTYLGASEVSLDELTLAFTTFPDGGKRPSRGYIIDRIIDTTAPRFSRPAPRSSPPSPIPRPSR